jgi:hypothetical protein
MSDREHLIEAARILRERAEQTGYGMAMPEDPSDFSPDAEVCTAEEIARHKAACAAYDRGEALPREPTWTAWKTREEAVAYVRSCMERGAASASISESAYQEVNEPMQWRVHCHVGGWGMGTYTYRDEQMIEAAKACETLAQDMPFDAGEDV